MIIYRLATSDDNDQLLQLTSSSAMQGEISLLIDRKPDFFKLLHLRGESKTFVAVKENVIIGSASVSQQQVYVDGQILPLQYIGDFKVAEGYRNQGIGLQICNELADYVVSIGSDLTFLNVSKGNNKPFSFFKNRPNIPDFENIGVFYVHQFPGKKKVAKQSQHFIEQATVSSEVIRFLNAHYARYQLGSVITDKQLKDTYIFLIRENEKIIAAMCLMDPMGIKQNIVTRLSLRMKIITSLLNIANRISGFSQLPELGQPIRMIYIKYLAAESRHMNTLLWLIEHARNLVYEKKYSFLSIGLHETDPLNKYLAGLRKFTFKSVGMLLSIKNNSHLIESVKRGTPFADYSIV